MIDDRDHAALQRDLIVYRSALIYAGIDPASIRSRSEIAQILDDVKASLLGGAPMVRDDAIPRTSIDPDGELFSRQRLEIDLAEQGMRLVPQGEIYRLDALAEQHLKP